MPTDGKLVGSVVKPTTETTALAGIAPGKDVAKPVVPEQTGAQTPVTRGEPQGSDVIPTETVKATDTRTVPSEVKSNQSEVRSTPTEGRPNHTEVKSSPVESRANPGLLMVDLCLDLSMRKLSKRLRRVKLQERLKANALRQAITLADTKLSHPPPL